VNLAARTVCDVRVNIDGGFIETNQCPDRHRGGVCSGLEHANHYGNAQVITVSA
jgi:hypothetical protein